MGASDDVFDGTAYSIAALAALPARATSHRNAMARPRHPDSEQGCSTTGARHRQSIDRQAAYRKAVEPGP